MNAHERQHIFHVAFFGTIFLLSIRSTWITDKIKPKISIVQRNDSILVWMCKNSHKHTDKSQHALYLVRNAFKFVLFHYTKMCQLFLVCDRKENCNKMILHIRIVSGAHRRPKNLQLLRAYIRCINSSHSVSLFVCEYNLFIVLYIVSRKITR